MTKRLHNRRGSDDARSWARSIHFGNQYAKAIMMAVANYCNEDGTAYPGIETLHQDTEIASNTIVARLKWIESIGAITLAKCWVDEHGNRNKQGRGRLTSTEIRFLFDADIEAIEAAARDNSSERPLRGVALKKHEEKINAAVCISPHEGQTESVSPSVAPQQPITPRGRILESESLSPTPFPQSGGKGDSSEGKKNKESEKQFQEFKSTYPDGIVDCDKARRAFMGLGGSDRLALIAAMPHYADRCRRRREKSKKAHLFIKERGWEGVTAAPAGLAIAPRSYPSNSREGRAILILGRIGRYSPWRPNGDVSFTGVVTPRLLALADAPPESEWRSYPRGSQSCGAWLSLVNECFAGCALPAVAHVEAPWPFPPRVDGTISSVPSPSASTGPPQPFLTDEDEAHLVEHGL